MGSLPNHPKIGANEPIAIVGTGCRFPGLANSPSKLWELLSKPRDLLTKIPNERFNPDAFYHPDGLHHGTSNVTESYLLQEDHRVFDAGFFNIKPVEAHSIDPQQRLLLETVYESLESAGIPMESLVGSQTGVYVGLMCGDYSEHLQRDVDSMPTYMPTGTARSIISNRISYFFDWHGPSMTIDTACSSSLVAVHQAVQFLRSGDSEVAIAAGANLILEPELYIGESKLKMLSPGSRSRMWDVDADGYARGEGIAAIVMKRLSTAIQDGDHIECIIRESGLNQDGRTKGITMPSHIAQADLIAKTYAKAGLDPREQYERCQYFEAHGTGTTAGDAVEAEAISKAFFGPEYKDPDPNNKLYVGSIKTIIGHTEGTAGLAGFLKASLAIQMGVVPPNMLFNKLSPAVAPFYHNLEIVTSATPWPDLPEGVARRASVNSFGFGGSNAHVILENYQSSSQPTKSSLVSFAPFVFSAMTEQALRATLLAYSTYVQKTPDLNLRDLSDTLHSKRSALPVRTAIAAASPEALISNIEQRLEEAKADPGKSIGLSLKWITEAPQFFGIFTGQGAQWPGMGRELVAKSAFVRDSMADFDNVLQNLPEADRPSNWSLTEQIMASSATSRVGEAVVAQPICTAIQIILVDLLYAAGIRFKAVVGHSSGEIAAAYASGFLDRHEAIKIAYYRGLFANLAGKTKKGAMMAVGTSMEDATELCGLPAFEDRLCVAACNSPSTVTLSGDADAIEEAKVIFEEEKKFARLLKVEKAYHSHHMLPCSDAYVEALRSCHIQPRNPNHGCQWFSSTIPGKRMGVCEELSHTYWKDNMVSPVLFAQAIEAAFMSESPFDMAIEVGPHPALKGPVLQNLSKLQPASYTGTLERGINDLQAFAQALGHIWSRLGPAAVDLRRYDALISEAAKKQLVKSLPAYQWDHDRIFWHDSRASRAYRTRQDCPHPLLGSRIMEGIDAEMRWKNLLKPSELPWVRGHQLQNQTVLPAAAYISTAIEASKALATVSSIGLVEVCDFVIGKPLTFEDDDTGVETLFSLAEISRNHEESVTATFTYYACTSQASDSLTRLASGRLIVRLGDSSPDWLPPPSAEPPNMVAVDEKQFYTSLDNLGYGYTGDFRTLASMSRKLNFGSAKVSVPEEHESLERSMLVHPAMLDAAFQAIFLAYWWPNDGSFEQLHVPTSIQNIRVNVGLCKQQLLPGAVLPLHSHLTENPLATAVIKGDVDIFDPNKQSSVIQVEGVRVVAFAEGSPQYDHQLFSEHIWDVAFPDGELAMNKNRATTEDYELARALERASLFYLKKLDTEIPLEARENFLEWNHEALFDFATYVLGRFRAGKQPFAQKEWLDDSWEQIDAVMAKSVTSPLPNELVSNPLARYPDSIEMKLTRTVGENLPRAVRGETNMLQHLFADNLLNTYYTDAMGLKEFTEFLSQIVSQIVHRYPHMQILEIGAGTGGATKSILRHIGQTFSSYTYTDISTGFFEEAQEVFAAQAGKMIFRALDVENDIEDQGYLKHSYDLVIGSLVLHATRDLRKTLRNARRLLKPGGYLLLQEITNIDVLRVGFAMSGLPGWWLGREDGRRYSPCVTSAEWHSLLLETGFSGIDTITPEVDILPRPLSIITAQATNEHIDFLRNPLLQPGENLGMSVAHLVIIGGQTLRTFILIDEVKRILRPWQFSVTRIRSLQDLKSSDLLPSSLVLSVTELDNPIWEDFAPETMAGLKQLMELQRTVLWITQGCRSEQPYMNMSVGFGRSLALENPDLRLQFMDLDASAKPSPPLIAAALLRLHLTAHLAHQGAIDSILWSTEQEMVYEDGRQLIPRLVTNKELNDRYNSSKRLIMESKEAHSCTLQLVPFDSGYRLMENHFLNSGAMNKPQEQDSEIYTQVSHSLLDPIATGARSSAYIVLGNELSQGNRVIGLSQSNGNRLVMPRDMITSCNVPAGLESIFLAIFEVELEVDMILSFCASESQVLIHEPDPEMAGRLLVRAAETKTKTNFWFSTSNGERLGVSWLQIHPRSPSRAIKAALPPKISIFIDCSLEGKHDDLGRLVSSCLPTSCTRSSIADANGHMGRGEDSGHIFMERFAIVVHRTLSIVHRIKSDGLQSKTPKIISPADAACMGAQNVGGPVIIEWTMPGKVSLQLSSVESQTHFAPDRTYVFFGLTSDLGTSLCDWFVSRGARNVVLTSRNPKIDKRWLDQMKTTGARIEVFANDITDRKALGALVAKIRDEFPPIAGIMHGAMVLEDTSFFEMSYETMQKVLKPKVLGCIYLDELFDDASLDFFILFSSLAAVSGNRGQSNYSAANLFLAATANQRRRKGLAGSVLHIGAVMGVGYVTREVSETVFSAIRKAGFKWMSERDFHQCIAESIITGRPLSKTNPEIVTGLRVINPDDEEPAPWMNIPRFQHCIVKGATGAEKAIRGTVGASTKARLSEAVDQVQILEVVKSKLPLRQTKIREVLTITDAFLTKLQAALQISAESTDEQDKLLESGPDDLGIDSLVAVEIRSWFLKELEIDMPVLKILGGSTLLELINFAVEKIPEHLVPNMSNEDVPEKATGMQIDPPNAPVSKTNLEHESTGSESLELTSSISSDIETSVTSSAPESLKSAVFQKTQLQKTLPMTPGQLRFWFLSHLLEDKTTSNIAFSIKLSGIIREGDLKDAVRAMGARHEALRTCFFTDENQRPMQGILAESELRLQKRFIASANEVSQEFEDMKNRVFDIRRGEIMACTLLALNQTENFLVIGYHHINMDGISLEVFLSDLEKAYNHKNLSVPVLQYSEHSSKQLQEIESGKMKEEIEYWKTNLANHPPPLPLLPFSSTRGRSALEKYDHNREDYRFDDSTQMTVRKMCQKQKAAPFHFYFAVFEVLLFKLLHVEDLCIGMADAGRLDEASSKSMGAYLNLLPLRFHLASNQTFAEVLKDTRKKAYAAMANSQVPFDTILDELKLERSTAYSPLFQAFINYRQGVSEKRSFGSFQGEGGEYAFGRTSYDITLDIMENPGSGTLVMFMVQKQIYSSNDAKKLGEMYLHLVKQFSESPTSRLEQVSLFPKEKIDAAIKLGQGTSPSQMIETGMLTTPGPIYELNWPDTLAHQIDVVSSKHPNAIAVKDTQGSNVSYKQMMDRSNQIASALLDGGGSPRANIVVYQEPSIDWICSLLAVWRIGGVYIPFDVNIPSARLELMLETCQPSVMLTHAATAANGKLLQASKTMAVKDVSTISGISPTIPIRARGSDSAAILYTSGTTGTPKGVILSHSGLRNQVEGVTRLHGFGAETVLQQTALSFDLALDQVMTALCNGGTLVVVAQPLRRDPEALTEVIAREQVTYTSATPSEYLSWLQYGSESLSQSRSWTNALSVGEQYPWRLVERLRGLENALGHPLRLFNVYGPTEVTISSNRIELPREVREGQRIPVGPTLPNYSVYIIDDDMKPVPVGMPGEVMIGGAGVSLGYLKDGGGKFIPDPFETSLARRQGSAMAYRTGDRGVLREDGALEILGRIAGDTQVKLRGIRIEMEDIESTILRIANGAVSEVVVTMGSDHATLVAHAVLTSVVETGDDDEFLRQLATKLPLPQYMRPAAIIPISEMPRSAHGKIDRRAVAQLPYEKSTGRSTTDGLTSMELQMRDIWVSVLPERIMQLHTIGADSDFFQVGGNSMLLIKLQREIQMHFNVDLPVIRLFENITLAAMAAATKGSRVNGPIIIDWEGETAVPDDILQQGTRGRDDSNLHTPPQIAILTGATGFLGKELLRQLLRTESIQQVHCIAVRDETKLTEFSDSRIQIHQGDLRDPLCGLSDAAAKDLFDKADLVIHNGADVSFLKSYASLRAANVTSTKELLKLSLPRRIPFHYISSVAAGRITGAETFAEVSLASHPPPVGFKDNYAATKWASEVFLEKAAAAMGGSLPVWIHRPSSITGEGVPDLDIMHNMMIYSVLTGTVPASEKWKGTMDFISVEKAAEGILQDALVDRRQSVAAAATTAGGAAVEFRHQAGEIVVAMEDMRAYLEKETGAEFAVVSLNDWIEKAREQGLSALVADFLTEVEKAEEDVVFQKLVRGKGEEI
ncbi:MAG: hypothetical protein Q9224_000596 [Gallowayella concinna]